MIRKIDEGMVINMTKKRFEVVKTMSDNNVAVKDMTDMTTHQMLDYGSALDICILLNELNDKADRNEQLKSEYKVLHTQHQDLRKFVENNFDEYLTREKLNRQIIKLSNENERLKKENQELKKFQYEVFKQIDKMMWNDRE